GESASSSVPRKLFTLPAVARQAMKVSGRVEPAGGPAPPLSRSAHHRQVPPAAPPGRLAVHVEKTDIGHHPVVGAGVAPAEIFCAPTFRITHAAFVPTLFPLVLMKYGGLRSWAACARLAAPRSAAHTAPMTKVFISTSNPCRRA